MWYVYNQVWTVDLRLNNLHHKMETYYTWIVDFTIDESFAQFG